VVQHFSNFIWTYNLFVSVEQFVSKEDMGSWIHYPTSQAIQLGGLALINSLDGATQQKMVAYCLQHDIMMEKNKVLTTDHIRGSPEFASTVVQHMIDGCLHAQHQQHQQAADEEVQTTDDVPMDATPAEPTSGNK